MTNLSIYTENKITKIISDDSQLLTNYIKKGYCHTPEKLSNGMFSVTVSDNWVYRSTFRRKNTRTRT